MKMTLKIYKLEEIYADLWRPYNLPWVLKRIHIGSFLDEFIYKLWVLLFQNKNEFFNTFKL